jgi:ABC-2 type transport system permease protein
MNNTFLVMRHEIKKTLRSTGYVIFAFILPVLAVLILVGVKFVRGRSGGETPTTSSPPTRFEMAVEGYVDQSGLLQELPDNIPSNRLLRFDSEELAQEALADDLITAYYLIPADFFAQGKVYYVYPDERSYLDDGQPWVMNWTLLFNLLGDDAALADRIWNPIRDVTATSLAPQAATPTSEDCSRPGAACRSNDLVRYMPSIMVALFFVTFMTSSNMLFNSIGAEKENRMLEVLMLAVSPRQLLVGKTLGLGTAGLLQAVLWLVAVYTCFNLGGATLSLPAGFEFPLEILIWGLVFFLGGFGLYAGMMAGAGALVPKMKEAGAANYLVMVPLFIGYALGLMAPLSDNASSPLILVLSFFPLTSPVVMMMRITNSSVPLWQLSLSTLLLFGSAVYILRAAAALFHTQTLLSGQAFSLRRFFGVMFARQ